MSEGVVCSLQLSWPPAPFLFQTVWLLDFFSYSWMFCSILPKTTLRSRHMQSNVFLYSGYVFNWEIRLPAFMLFLLLCSSPSCRNDHRPLAERKWMMLFLATKQKTGKASFVWFPPPPKKSASPHGNYLMGFWFLHKVHPINTMHMSESACWSEIRAKAAGSRRGTGPGMPKRAGTRQAKYKIGKRIINRFQEKSDRGCRVKRAIPAPWIREFLSKAPNMGMKKRHS